MRAEKVKRNLTASGDGSEISTAGPGVKEDQGYAKLSSQDQGMGFSFSSPVITNLHQLPHNNMSG